MPFTKKHLSHYENYVTCTERIIKHFAPNPISQSNDREVTSREQVNPNWPLLKLQTNYNSFIISGSFYMNNNRHPRRELSARLILHHLLIALSTATWLDKLGPVSVWKHKTMDLCEEASFHTL